MRTYTIATPTKAPGLYLLKNTKTGQMYIGKSMCLRQRFTEWRMVVMSGMGCRAYKMAEAIKQSDVHDWEFVVFAEFPGITNDELAKYEARAIKKFKERKPECMLNTDMPFERKVKVPTTSSGTGRASRSLSTVTGPDGHIMSQREIATALGVGIDSVQDRLACWRAKGIYELTLDEYRQRREKSLHKKGNCNH